MNVQMRNFLSYSAVALCLLPLAACKEDKKNAGAAPPPAEVNIVAVEPADTPLLFEYAGRTAGSREVEIRARVNGIILKRNYVEGQKVKQGQVLFTIDPEPFKAEAARTQANLTQTESELKRVEALYKEKAISGRERDVAVSQYGQAKAEAESSRINLGWTTVIAPITGVTSQENLSEGSLVTANTTLLTRLTQLDPLYVNFAYPDTESLAQRQDMASGKMTMPEDGKLQAEIRFGDGSVYKETGAVNFTDSIIDEQTGTVRARAVVPNPDNAVLPGQFVRVVIKGFTRKDAITVPDQAVMQGPQGTFVYTVSAESKAAIAPVVLGPVNNKIRIIESGLKAGDKVIVDNLIKVRPDAPVTIAAPKPPEGEPAPATPAEKKE